MLVLSIFRYLKLSTLNVRIEKAFLGHLAKTNAEHELMYIKPPDLPENPRILKVALLGAPNSGKSTLFNRILGWKVSSVSSKENTTRHRITGVFTDKDCQVVFLDTPGIMAPWRFKKRVLVEKSLVMDPHSALWEADIVLVVHDVSDKFRKHCIDEEILKCLFSHPDKESILVLNKVDALKRKRELLELTSVLTDGKLNGITYIDEKNKNGKINFDLLYDKTYKELYGNGSEETSDLSKDTKLIEDLHSCENELLAEIGNKTKTVCPYTSELDKISDLPCAEYSSLKDITPFVFYNDIMMTKNWHLYYQKLSLVSKFVQGQKSWAYFNQVFMISALNNDGIGELKRYLLSQCKPGKWWFHRNVLTDQFPQDIAQMIVREKMFEILPQEIPYSLRMEVDNWELGVLDDLMILINIYPRSKSNSRDVASLLRRNGEAIKRIADEAREDLMRIFNCDIRLKLVVKTTPRRK